MPRALKTPSRVPAIGLSGLFGIGGATVGVVAWAVDSHPARQAASQSWPAFVLVAGLLLVGVVAAEDGTFNLVGQKVSGLLAGDTAAFVGAAVLVTLATASLNLDTSVVFVTPVLVASAQHRGRDERPTLYASLLLANAASLFLPGSNLTNVIVFGHSVSGARFLAHFWLPATCAVVTAAGVLSVWARRYRQGRPVTPRIRRGNGRVGPVAVVVALVLVLVLPSPALPLFGLGLATAAVRVAGQRLSAPRVFETLGLPVVVGLFGMAVAAGTLGRVWAAPAHAVAHGGWLGAAGLGAVASVLCNNLPAAALLAARHPAHVSALLIGLNLGPNLLPTGSLAWFLWLRAAHTAGVTPSIGQAIRLGLMVVPVTMAAALVALRFG